MIPSLRTERRPQHIHYTKQSVKARLTDGLEKYKRQQIQQSPLWSV